jgi:hypothetical protein
MRKTRASANLQGRGGDGSGGEMEDIIPRGDDCRDLQPLGSFPATRVLNFAFSGRGTPSRFLVETETDHQNGILQRMSWESYI